MKLIILLFLTAVAVALPRSRQTIAATAEEPLEIYPEGPETFETEPEEFYNENSQDSLGYDTEEPQYDTEPAVEEPVNEDAETISKPTYFVFRFRPRPINPWSLFDRRFDQPSAPVAPIMPRPFFPSFFGNRRVPEEPQAPRQPSFFNTFLDMFNPTRSFGPNFADLPANYSNSTHEVKDINGTKVVVNQTIEKSSGDNFHNFYHFKVIRLLPDGEVVEEDIPVEDSIPSDDSVVDEQPEFIPSEDGASFIPENNVYNIPEENVDFERENEIIPVEVSDSEVYDMFDDMPTSDYKRRSRSSKRHSDKLYDWFKPEKKFDLSSDTRVNRIASNRQQTFSMVDEDAEVFDLELVLREQEGKND